MLTGLISGPWQGKQLRSKIGKTSSAKFTCSVSTSLAGLPLCEEVVGGGWESHPEHIATSTLTASAKP